MFAQLFDVPRAERRRAVGEAGAAGLDRRHPQGDLLAQIALANAADASLLRLVVGAAGAMLLLALASSLL